MNGLRTSTLTGDFMSDKFEFREHVLSEPLLKTLRSCRAVNTATRDLLALVFEHGGYIAGGFGTVLARFIVAGIGQNSGDGIWEPIREHLGSPTPHAEKIVGSPFHNVGCGDIDVWFTDEASLQGFLLDPRRLKMIDGHVVSINTTASAAAIEHIVNGDARIQTITKYLMPPQEQIEHFDIYNGMVASTNDKIVYPEHFVQLETNNMLHVANWNSPWTVNRLFKWINRKRYKSVTPATAHVLTQKAIEARECWRNKVNMLKVSKDPEVELWLEKWNVDKLKRAVANGRMQWLLYTSGALPHLSGEQLLTLAMYFKPNDQQYDYITHEIINRMPPTF